MVTRSTFVISSSSSLRLEARRQQTKRRPQLHKRLERPAGECVSDSYRQPQGHATRGPLVFHERCSRYVAAVGAIGAQ